MMKTVQANIVSRLDADDAGRRLRTYDYIYYEGRTKFRHGDVNKRLC